MKPHNYRVSLCRPGTARKPTLHKWTAQVTVLSRSLGRSGWILRKRFVASDSICQGRLSIIHKEAVPELLPPYCPLTNLKHRQAVLRRFNAGICEILTPIE